MYQQGQTEFVYVNQPQQVVMSPMMVQQQQPMMVQQQQPMMMQQQQQPMMFQQQQPMMMQQQFMVQQPMGQQQPMMQQQQAVYYLPSNQQQVGVMNTGAPNGLYVGDPMAVHPTQNPQLVMIPPMDNPALMQNMQGNVELPPNDIKAVQELFNKIKNATCLSITYMERNFRGEGGFKFSINYKNTNTLIAYGYTTTKGDITIETLDKDSPFAICQVKNGTSSYYDPQKGQRVNIGGTSITLGSCKSFVIVGEKSGVPLISFQNDQFNLGFCCLCPLLYFLQIHVCRNTIDFDLHDKEKQTLFGGAKYKTDELKTFKTLELIIYNSKDIEKNITSIITSLMFMNKRVQSAQSQQEDEYF